jgi:hypothetical protein
VKAVDRSGSAEERSKDDEYCRARTAPDPGGQRRSADVRSTHVGDVDEGLSETKLADGQGESERRNRKGGRSPLRRSDIASQHGGREHLEHRNQGSGTADRCDTAQDCPCEVPAVVWL